MFEISIRSNIRELQKSLSDLAYKQLPFATSLALTELARDVQAAEKANMAARLDRPTPFTVNSVAVIPARKGTLVATVYVRDIAAAYLEPYEVGGQHKLIGKGKTWLNPKQVSLNAYGNVPGRKLKQMLSRGTVFVGAVKGKGGKSINGVWQRVKAAKGMPAHLKLIVRFGDAMTVNQRLNYQALAQIVVAHNLDRRMGAALARAIASAR